MRMGSPFQSDSMRHARDVCEGICDRMMLHFSYYCKYGVLVLLTTGQALLMSPKERNGPGMVSSNYGSELLLFAILLLCEITTSFV